VSFGGVPATSFAVNSATRLPPSIRPPLRASSMYSHNTLHRRLNGQFAGSVPLRSNRHNDIRRVQQQRPGLASL